MAKIHQLQKTQKTSVNKSTTTQRAKLPILPRLLNWIKIRIIRHSNYTYDSSWNAAFKTFTLLRSVTKGVKKLEVLIVSSTFKAASTEVDAVVMDYSDSQLGTMMAWIMHATRKKSFPKELLDNRTIGAVIKGEHTEMRHTSGYLAMRSIVLIVPPPVTKDVRPRIGFDSLKCRSTDSSVTKGTKKYLPEVSFKILSNRSGMGHHLYFVFVVEKIGGKRLQKSNCIF